MKITINLALSLLALSGCAATRGPTAPAAVKANADDRACQEVGEKLRTRGENVDHQNIIDVCSQAIDSNLKWKERDFPKLPESNLRGSYLLRARALVLKGDHAKAVSDYSEVIRKDESLNNLDQKSRAFHFFERGQAYALAGECDAAIGDFKETVKLTIVDSFYMGRLARAMARCGKEKEAIAAIDDFLREMQTRFGETVSLPPMMFADRAVLNYSLGEKERATQDCKKACGDRADGSYCCQYLKKPGDQLDQFLVEFKAPPEPLFGKVDAK